MPDTLSQSQHTLAVLGCALLGIVALYTVRKQWPSLQIPIIKSSKEEESSPIDPTDYAARARRILRLTPLIDGHNDFPFLLRQQLRSKIYDHDFLTERLACHSDFQKMRQGLMGGQFWSVFVPVPEDLVPGVDLNDETRPSMDLNEPNVCLAPKSWISFYLLVKIYVTRLLTHYRTVGRPRHARANRCHEADGGSLSIHVRVVHRRCFSTSSPQAR